MEREKYQGLDVYTVEEFQEMLDKGQTEFNCMRVVGKSNFLSTYTPYSITVRHCYFERFSWKFFGAMKFDNCTFENVDFVDGKYWLIFSHCSFLVCSFKEGDGSLDFCDSSLSAVEITDMKLSGILYENSHFRAFTFEKNLTHNTIFKILNCSFISPILVSCKEFEQALEQQNRVPTEGSFIAWKKAMTSVPNDNQVPVLIKLEIPADAERIGISTSGKCRASKAKVLAITSTEEDKEYQEAYSWKDSSFKYKVGETAKVDDFDSSPFTTCTRGIHFFLSKEAAKQYNI